MLEQRQQVGLSTRSEIVYHLETPAFRASDALMTETNRNE
jgi:hypothetical protein